MKQSTTFITLAFIAALAAGCNQPHETTSNAGPDKTSLSGTPMSANTVANSNANMAAANANVGGDRFWSEAASGGMAEVELGKLASSKSQNADVKRFAEMMITDHGKGNDELKALATKKNIALPSGPDPRHQATMQQLQGMTGADFDRAYVDAMVKDHEATVQLFESQAEDGTDADAKAFAAKTLPTLRKHLDMIKDIKSKMK